MLKPSDFNNAVPQFPNGSYASNPINPQYIAEPDAENYNKGTEPLQTLPAQWWNWFLNKFTSRFNKINIYVKNIFNELAQVLSIFNITPDGTEQTPTTSQLKTVFESCYPQYVKTAASLVGTETTVNGHPLSSNVTVTKSDLGLGTSATLNTGTAVGCIPTVGTALGTTNNNILVTDSTGKLKPSGITVGTAAGCAATFFAKKTELDDLYGNVVGTPLGTAAVGTCTTFARSDHVHPMPTTVACANCLYSVCSDGIYSDPFGNFRPKENRMTSYWHVDRYDSTPVFSVHFEENYVCAPVFCGCLSGNATSATGACCATTSSYLRSVCRNGICTDVFGNFNHMTDDISDTWSVFNHAGDSIFSVFFEQNFVRACCFCGNATNAGVTCTFGLAVGRRNETMRQWSATWDNETAICDIYKAICWAMNDATCFGTMSIVGSIGCSFGEYSSYACALERNCNSECGCWYRIIKSNSYSECFYESDTRLRIAGRIGGVY